MLRSHYVVLPKRSCGSSTGQGERASVERLFVVGRLQNAVEIGNVKWEKKTNVSSCSSRLMLVKANNALKSATVIPVVYDDTYPNSVGCHPSASFHLIEQELR